MIILEGFQLNKIYGKGISSLKVLKSANLSVEKGEILAVVGPSGAGKSTLLHILGGLDKPTSGKVSFEGQDLYRMSDAQRASVRNIHMGFIFQFYYLLPEFNAIENVCMPAFIQKYKKPDIESKAIEILSRLGLGERLRHYPSQLSGGEMQRVAIARALINEPDILFCDEPTGNLDSESGEQIKDLLWNLNRTKKQTIVLVTHDEELAKGAKRIFSMKDGVLEESANCLI